MGSTGWRSFAILLRVDFERFGEDVGSGPVEPFDERLVARTVRDIDGRTVGDLEVLLSALRSAAWPALASQLQ